MSRFRPIDRKTAYLLPPSVEDWLPEDHLARFIVEAMEQLDLSNLVRAYAGRGSAAYHPEVMLGLLVYGYATGLFSSRKIERATYDSVAFRYLAAGRKTYGLRKQTVELVFGIIKSVMGFRQFLLRGMKKVTGEWTLVCLAWNLKRMAVLRHQSVQCP